MFCHSNKEVSLATFIIIIYQQMCCNHGLFGGGVWCYFCNCNSNCDAKIIVNYCVFKKCSYGAHTIILYVCMQYTK